MFQFFWKYFFALILLGSISFNSLSALDWVGDFDATELYEMEQSEKEKEEQKKEKEKDEIFVTEDNNRFHSLLPLSGSINGKVTPNSIQCREVVTPPPEFI